MWILIILGLLFVLSISIRPISTDRFHTAIVKDVYNTSMLVKEKGHKYYLLGVDNSYLPGDVITYRCSYITETSDKGSFDIFWRSKGAVAYGWADNVEVVSQTVSLRNDLLNVFIGSDSYYSQGILALLYGKETDSNAELLDMVTQLGVSYLFVLSGFHIAIFFVSIEKVGGKITNNRYAVNLVCVSVTVVFLYFIYFPLTAVRALITLQIIRTHRFNKIDSLSICGLLFFVINPYSMISNSMILSFSITAGIYLIIGKGVKFSETVLVSIMAFYVSLPTIATWETDINLLSPLINILITPIVSFTYIFGMLLVPFHFLWPIGNAYFFLFNIMIQSLSIFYIPMTIETIGVFKQFIAITITLLYISQTKGHRLILLNTFLSISIIFFII